MSILVLTSDTLIGTPAVGNIEYSSPIFAATPAPTYKELRAAKYSSFADQFDLLYHGGMDAWKSAIQAVKDKYPKG